MIYRKLTEDEISTLQANSCWAEDWQRIEVSEDFEPRFFHRVMFYGDIRLGAFTDNVEVSRGFMKHSGVNNATLRNVTIGNNCLIENISGYINGVGIGQRGYCFLEDLEGNLVYHPQQQLLYAGLKKEEAGRLACLGDGTYVEDTVIYSVQRVPGSTWRVVGVSYIDETVNESFRQMVRIIRIFGMPWRSCS